LRPRVQLPAAQRRCQIQIRRSWCCARSAIAGWKFLLDVGPTYLKPRSGPADDPLSGGEASAFRLATQIGRRAFHRRALNVSRNQASGLHPARQRTALLAHPVFQTSRTWATPDRGSEHDEYTIRAADLTGRTSGRGPAYMAALHRGCKVRLQNLLPFFLAGGRLPFTGALSQRRRFDPHNRPEAPQPGARKLSPWCSAGRPTTFRTSISTFPHGRLVLHHGGSGSARGTLGMSCLHSALGAQATASRCPSPPWLQELLADLKSIDQGEIVIDQSPNRPHAPAPIPPPTPGLRIRSAQVFCRPPWRPRARGFTKVGHSVSTSKGTLRGLQRPGCERDRDELLPECVCAVRCLQGGPLQRETLQVALQGHTNR